MNPEAIKESISVPEVLELLGVAPPQRIPGMIPCFLHEESDPSLAIYEDHFHCYGCGRHGDVLDLVQAAGASYKKALSILNRVAEGLDAEGPRVQAQERVVEDMTDRFNSEPEGGPMLRDIASEMIQQKWPTLDLTTVERFGVKVTRTGLWIPHWDHSAGVIVGIKIRAYNGSKTAVKGSTFTTGLYWVQEPRYRLTAVLCEGESDTWAMTKFLEPAGAYAVYGLPSGAKAWKPEFERQLRRHEAIWLALDGDKTGREATAQVEAKLAPFPPVRDLQVPDGLDVAKALSQGWDPRVSV